MYISETKDVDEIKKILCHPEIADRIGFGEYMNVDDFDPPMDIQYIGGYIGNEIIGLMIYNKDGKRLKCHFQVLPEYRARYSGQFLRMALKTGEAKNASIYAEIPDCYPDVIRFAKRFDFKAIGVEKAGQTRKGIPYDVTILRRQNEHS